MSFLQCRVVIFLFVGLSRYSFPDPVCKGVPSVRLPVSRVVFSESQQSVVPLCLVLVVLYNGVWVFLPGVVVTVWSFIHDNFYPSSTLGGYSDHPYTLPRRGHLLSKHLWCWVGKERIYRCVFLTFVPKFVFEHALISVVALSTVGFPPLLSARPSARPSVYFPTYLVVLREIVCYL